MSTHVFPSCREGTDDGWAEAGKDHPNEQQKGLVPREEGGTGQSFARSSRSYPLKSFFKGLQYYSGLGP